MNLYPHQVNALNRLDVGSILYGKVGSGKTITSLAYFIKYCGGYIGSRKMSSPRDLYIITTARKRDSKDWTNEANSIGLISELSTNNCRFHVDSWNNISKYRDVSNSFFIFDEQKVIGSGAWVKSFLKIAADNPWILLSGTPGDSWVDYIPVFVANGFYKNRTRFFEEHVVFEPYTKFPKIKKFIGTKKLEIFRDKVLVEMPFENKAERIYKDISVEYDKALFKDVFRNRWNPYTNEPIINTSTFYHVLLRITNTHPSRIQTIKRLTEYHNRIIVFYNYNYELELLRAIDLDGFTKAEWNGSFHDPIPTTIRWLYFVQYIAGAEAWNCIETNAIVFYSQVDSYKMLEQSRGRIDRMNTTYSQLYYYTLISDSPIDNSKVASRIRKKDFNERKFISRYLQGV